MKKLNLEKTIKLNSDHRDLILGTLLGDGNLQTETQGRTWRYRAVHSSINEEYLNHKYEILKPFCHSGVISEKIYDPRTLKYYQRLYFNTKVLASLKFYANLFYQELGSGFRKIIPKNIAKFLTARSLAYWFMDDGSLKWKGISNALRISTEGFSDLCIQRLQKALLKKFNILAKLVQKKTKGVFKGYILYINEENSLIFRKLIEPYLLPSMLYKITLKK